MNKTIKFINCWKIYVTGDIATIEEAQANLLVQRGYAEEVTVGTTADARAVQAAKESDEVKQAAKDLEKPKEAVKSPMTSPKSASKTSDKAVKKTADKAIKGPKNKK